MASPYSLDFSPINEAIDTGRQLALARNKLAMEQERLGWERDRQPLLLKALGQDVSHAGVMNPLNEQKLRGDISERGQMFPYDLRQKKTATESAEEAQAITRQYREEQGFSVPNSAARLPTAGAPAAAPQAAPVRSNQAKVAADTIENYVLKVPDAAAAQTNWKMFQEHPELGPKWQEHVRAYGTTGDWRRDASDFVRDMRHEANGTVLKPIASVTVAPPVVPTGPPAPVATPVVPPAAQPPGVAGPNSPLFPSIGGAMKGAERMAAVPGMSAAAEARFKLLQGIVDKGYMPTAPGSKDQVMPVTGAQEAEGSKKQSESFGTHTGQNNAAIVESRRRADISMGLLDQLEELAKSAYLKDPELLKAATGPIASSEVVQKALQGSRQVPLIGRAVPGSEESFNLNKRMHHIIEGLSTQIKIAASRGVVTDQAQRTFDSAIGKFMETDDPNTFFAILHDARNIIKGIGGYMPEPLKEDYIPKAQKNGAALPQPGARNAANAQPAQAAPKSLPPDQHARAIVEAREAVQQGKDPALVRQRLQQWGIDPVEAGF